MSGRPSVTLEESYANCRRLNRRYGTTYYLSTCLLPTVKRHHVHALYGFCRFADDIVDDLGQVPVEDRQAALAEFGDRVFTVRIIRFSRPLSTRCGPSTSIPNTSAASCGR